MDPGTVFLFRMRNLKLRRHTESGNSKKQLKIKTVDILEVWLSSAKPT